VETHIFLCVLAHLLIAIEKSFLDQGIHTSWVTLREQLGTHQVVTAVLSITDGNLLKIRQATTTPDPQQRLIYRVLAIPEEVRPPIKTWLPAQMTASPGGRTPGIVTKTSPNPHGSPGIPQENRRSWAKGRQRSRPVWAGVLGEVSDELGSAYATQPLDESTKST
jgi:hypothetical protein